MFVRDKALQAVSLANLQYAHLPGGRRGNRLPRCILNQSSAFSAVFSTGLRYSRNPKRQKSHLPMPQRGDDCVCDPGVAIDSKVTFVQYIDKHLKLYDSCVTLVRKDRSALIGVR